MCRWSSGKTTEFLVLGVWFTEMEVEAQRRGSECKFKVKKYTW